MKEFIKTLEISLCVCLKQIIKQQSTVSKMPCKQFIFFCTELLFSAQHYLKAAFLSANQNQERFPGVLLAN